MKYFGNHDRGFEYGDKWIKAQDEIEGDPSDVQIKDLLERGWIVTATAVPDGTSEDAEETAKTKKTAPKRGGEE